MTEGSPRGIDRARRWQWLVVAIAIALRAHRYLVAPPLWHDEAALALNVLERSFGGLLGPLDFLQAAPAGFLSLAKLGVVLFGSSGYALRLVPFIAGIVSVFLFDAVARRVLPSPGATAALLLFCLSSALIDYGAELKQYSSDVCVALGLLLLLPRWPAPGDVRGAARLAALGAAAVWLSYPAAFVLAGLATPPLLQSLRRRNWRGAALLCAAAGFWALNVAWLYAAAERPMAGNPRVARYWSAGFMPLPPRSLEEWLWFPRTLGRILNGTAHLRPAWLAAVLAGAGLLLLFRRDRRVGWSLVLPALVTLLASGFRLYPFYGRPVLFLVPAVFLLVAEAFAFLWRDRRRLLAVVLVASVAFPVAAKRVEELVDPERGSEIPAALAYLRDEWRPGDFVYVYSGAEYSFRYYARRFGFAPDRYRIGISERKSPDKLLAELEGLRSHRRLWLVFAHVWRAERFSGEQWFLHHLNRWGKLERSALFHKASLYAFSLQQ